MTQRLLLFLKTFPLFLVVFTQLPFSAEAWGFFAHKQINRYAITTLPPDMFRFYKKHLTFLTEKSVNPDKRRYMIKHEAAKHFIDLEMYQTSSLHENKNLFKRVEKQDIPKDIIVSHGELPWAVLNVQKKLTQAFIHRDIPKILKLSADLGHYIADAHVPLHTTQNYDGQMTGQEGIHALWETRLPTLFIGLYNFFVGQASYIEDPLLHIWDIVIQSHTMVPKVLALEKQLSAQSPVLLKYSFEQSGKLLKKQYSVEFSTLYHQALQGQVEERLRQSIIQVGNFWLTAWMNAGSPSLDDFEDITVMQDQKEQPIQETIADIKIYSDQCTRLG
ncbi:zinc dependent phospholipase C family protein [Candidatus Cardinium hertigii]|uniref:S1/P1 Nuclease n=1 Tax=Candidatus Cardinium hertigii TaxID=247481 RepID=A0A3N2QCA8_9BACT|nr:zinc dependent phospholipase C family protein [Candidatus Cardinium hertigii]ROT47309.1 S1/P1 Nuclease [Candidatus Cardinium hertigii]